MYATARFFVTVIETPWLKISCLWCWFDRKYPFVQRNHRPTGLKYNMPNPYLSWLNPQ